MEEKNSQTLPGENTLKKKETASGEGAAKNRKNKLLAALCAVGVLAAAAGVYLALRSPSDSLELDENANIGLLPGIDVAQRQAELQELLDESMIVFTINTNPVFENGGSEGNLMLENPVNNAKLLVVELYLDETEELIYKTKALPAGSYIENARLDKLLEPGNYPATAYFKAYREDDHSYIGQVGAALTIHVLT